MNVLIVDDHRLARESIKSQLDGRFTIFEASSFEDASEKIRSLTLDICFIDLKLDDSEHLRGLELIPLSSKKGIYSVVMTSIDDEKVTEAAYNSGCQDVYNKGNEKAHITETISRYLLSKNDFIEGYFFKDIIQTQSQKYKDDLKRLIPIIPMDLPVCLLGETGTGKTYLARAIHSISKREGNFVEINCSTFSGDTLKTELFGYKKGAFTGADSDTDGKLLLANGGTIFLDEVATMSPEMQDQLLKVIEEKCYYPIGANKLIKINVRVICATSKNLKNLVQLGKFKIDLFHRIAGFTFTQPSLRERKEDIIPFLNSALKGSRKLIIKEDIRSKIENHCWPGNIRELLNFVEVLKSSPSGIVKIEDFDKFTEGFQSEVTPKALEDHQFERMKEIGLKEYFEELTKEAVTRSLLENGNQTTKAMNDLKITAFLVYKALGKKVPKALNTPEQKGVGYEIQ